MKRIIIVIALIVSMINLYSQDYRHAFGIRGGLSSGFEYRAYVDGENAYKVLLGVRNRGMQLTGMKEFHIPYIFDTEEKFSFVYGVGIHAGFERWDVLERDPNVRYIKTKTSPIAGLDALAGLEYTFREIPVNIGLEVKPFFDLFGKNTFRLQPFDFAFTIKYLF